MQYSQVVKIKTFAKQSSVTIMPNPVTGKSINVYFENMDLGNYTLSILSYSGKTLHNQPIIIDGPNTYKQIIVKYKLASGNYLLRVMDDKAVSKLVPLSIVDKR